MRISDMWNNRTIGTKLLAIFATTLVVIATVQMVTILNDHRDASMDAMIERAAAFTALADETKNHVGRLTQNGSFDHESLMAELKASMEADPNFDYRDSRVFNTIPVVAGWTAAGEAATREGLAFHTPAFNARNPDNEPSADVNSQQGAFRADMLRTLTDAVNNGTALELHAVNEATNTLHYMRAIRLDNSCMSCHGTPGNPVHDPDGDGLDPLGFPMENWAVGDMHGAFEIAMPLDPLDNQVAGFLGGAAMVVVPMMVVGLGIVVFFIRAGFTKPMGRLIAQLRDVSEGDGDLTARLAINRNDELGMVSRAFDAFMDRLHTTISGVRDATNVVAESAGSIGEASERVATGMSDTASQVSQIAAAMEEMSQTAEEVASRSQQASTQTDQAGAEAAEGRNIVETTVAEIQEIANHVNESAKAVQSLGDRGEQIGEVISVIKDIADQTNLLALNAAIEAARAGEHGRGFAVVADEVRKLAERTTIATEEVASSISAIQKETEFAVQRMDSGRERVESGVNLATKAGAACEQIVEGSAAVATVVESIAAAAAEQAATANDVSRNIEQIDSVTKDTTKSTSEMTTSAHNLATNAAELNQLVNQFKL